MTPNEWGDWSAGLAAPVALGWLVLGYLQQSDELRKSTTALNAQANALRRSVRQQRRQAQLTEKSQALALRTQIVSHQPCFAKFTAKVPNQGKNTFAMWVENVGRTCFNARFVVAGSRSDAMRFKLPLGVRNWTGGSAHEIRLGQVPQPPFSLEFVVTYLDEVMAPQEQRFKMVVKRFPVHDEALGVSRIGMTHNAPDVTVPEIPMDDDDEGEPPEND
jgi:hypothetical protein